MYKTKQKSPIGIYIMPFFLLLTYVLAIAVPVYAKKNKQNIASAHSYRPLLEQYEYAKHIYKEGNYAEAKLLFNALKELCHGTSLAPYIYFYYALSAYYNGEKELASQNFSWIRLHFPLWNKQNETLYWCAQCKFEKGKLNEALTLLALIQDKRMSESMLRLKKHFLKKTEDLDCLQELVSHFPNETIIKQILYKKAARQAYITQDFSLVDALAKQYSFRRYLYDPLRTLKSKPKDSYRVAIFSPFFVEELNYESCTDQFVIDLYQGIKVAIEELSQEGVAITLFSFDTKNNPKVTTDLLAQEEMQYMDLIIGPLYPATIPLVATFAKKHKINFVNPISTNSSIINGHPFAFLFQPSLETCAQKAAWLTLSDIRTKLVAHPCIAVFYGTAREDVLQAELYKRIVKRELGRDVDFFLQFSNNNAIKDFFDKVGKAEEVEGVASEEEEAKQEEKQLDLKNITHIYVPSQHDMLVSSVVNFPFKLEIQPHIVGHEQWIKKEIINLNQLKKLQIFFLAPGYIDFNRPALTTFRERFFEKTAHPSNYYNYVGYEMMLFFGKMLATYGIYFQKEWENVYHTGMLFQGVHYGKHHSNQHIPVLHFSQNKFITSVLD
ncbi:hypothetical protein [Cardinium endosymbiont of Tipula unca]|uniref:hypothetical protein n=1 Tax=Cardinium endosymbiont of Tipula unca TaxID=3066216 RepID=UPI0030CE939F